MGWFSRTFSTSIDAKIERAEYFLTRHRYNDARLELIDVDAPKARNLLKEIHNILRAMNLEIAESRFSAYEYESAQEHLELARQFGATESQLREVRKQGRKYRQEQQEKHRKEKEAKQVHRDIGEHFIWGLPDDDPRLRYAMRLERYPQELHKRLIDLGTGFAEATLAIEDLSPQVAFDMLTPFVDKDPVARFERMRASLGAQRPKEALADLLIFSKEVGHYDIDGIHTHALLSQLLAHNGQSEQALKEIGNSKDAHPALSMVKAQILESQNNLEKAATEYLALIKKLPKNMDLYKHLARVKIKQNERAAASNVLESALNTCCKGGGCGVQAPDINLLRMLAQIYLEDRQQLARAKELLRDIQQMRKHNTWEDQYLSALASRNEGHPFSQNIVRTLLTNLSENDPRRLLVLKAFPQ